MALIREFFADIDAEWKQIGAEPIELQIIGSAALMLQVDYERATKDGDVLETTSVTPAVKGQLISIAGRGTEIHKRRRIYVDVVINGLPFLPHKAVFHSVRHLEMKHFKASALDITDTVVSKIKRLNNDDLTDIKAMADRRLLDHAKLIDRFNAAVDRFSMDARAEELPKYVANLNRIERDFLGVKPTRIELPDWMG